MKLFRLFTVLSIGAAPFLTSMAYSDEKSSYLMHPKTAHSTTLELNSKERGLFHNLANPYPQFP